MHWLSTDKCIWKSGDLWASLQNLTRHSQLHLHASRAATLPKKFILLRNHFKRHLAGRYQCGDCPNNYSQKNDLNDHKTAVHGYKICRKCSQQFDTVKDLLEHKSSHTTASSRSKSTKTAEKSVLTVVKCFRQPEGFSLIVKCTLRSRSFAVKFVRKSSSRK